MVDLATTPTAMTGASDNQAGSDRDDKHADRRQRQDVEDREQPGDRPSKDSRALPGPRRQSAPPAIAVATSGTLTISSMRLASPKPRHGIHSPGIGAYRGRRGK